MKMEKTKLLPQQIIKMQLQFLANEISAQSIILLFSIKLLHLLVSFRFSRVDDLLPDILDYMKG